MSDDTSSAKTYKKTLNLPRTSFPMKANLAQNEPQSVKSWKKSALYEQVRKARVDADRFIFHDGPPYANGDIHIGHLMNKVLKDLVVRSHIMEGEWCDYVPGWDCHGLPIEHRVMGELVESGKIEKLADLPEDKRRMAVRRECRKYAEKFQKRHREQMERLLTFADYDNPYLTMTPDFEGATTEVFADLVEQGLVYRDLKPVHWSIENQTALAEAELEYMDRDDPSIYVEFEAVDAEAVGSAFGVQLDQTPSFMIWTTTPWTLIANLMIAVHERFDYVLVRIDGSETVVARDLLETVTSKAGSDKVEVLGECQGKALLGMTYRHPLCEREGRVVAADYVTLEDGTGLVHTAPGHGADDYRTGLREGMPIYCPVLGDGTYDESVPEWMQGMSIWDANVKVLDRLRESGHLFHDYMFNHSYPHDWRGKSPVIFRATEQWFIGVDRPFGDGASLRERGLQSVREGIDFVPAWGRNRMLGMLESRPDWCLSRQRAWGCRFPPSAPPRATHSSLRRVSGRWRRPFASGGVMPGSSKPLRNYWPNTTTRRIPTPPRVSTRLRSRRCPTSSTSGSNPDQAGMLSCASGIWAIRSTSTWRDPISIEAGSRRLSFPRSARRGRLPTRP